MVQVYFIALETLSLSTIIKTEFFFPDLCSSPDHLDVRLGFDLCIQEQDFLCKRQNYVIPALKKVLQLEKGLLDHEVCRENI